MTGLRRGGVRPLKMNHILLFQQIKKGFLYNGIYGHSRFCNTDFDDKLACLNLSGV